jgi:hypothetical protein
VHLVLAAVARSLSIATALSLALQELLQIHLLNGYSKSGREQLNSLGSFNTDTGVRSSRSSSMASGSSQLEIA